MKLKFQKLYCTFYLTRQPYSYPKDDLAIVKIFRRVVGSMFN